MAKTIKTRQSTTVSQEKKSLPKLKGQKVTPARTPTVMPDLTQRKFTPGRKINHSPTTSRERKSNTMKKLSSARNVSNKDLTALLSSGDSPLSIRGAAAIGEKSKSDMLYYHNAVKKLKGKLATDGGKKSAVKRLNHAGKRKYSRECKGKTMIRNEKNVQILLADVSIQKPAMDHKSPKTDKDSPVFIKTTALKKVNSRTGSNKQETKIPQFIGIKIVESKHSHKRAKGGSDVKGTMTNVDETPKQSLNGKRSRSITRSMAKRSTPIPLPSSASFQNTNNKRVASHTNSFSQDANQVKKLKTSTKRKQRDSSDALKKDTLEAMIPSTRSGSKSKPIISSAIEKHDRKTRRNTEHFESSPHETQGKNITRQKSQSLHSKSKLLNLIIDLQTISTQLKTATDKRNTSTASVSNSEDPPSERTTRKRDQPVTARSKTRTLPPNASRRLTDQTTIKSTVTERHIETSRDLRGIISTSKREMTSSTKRNERSSDKNVSETSAGFKNSPLNVNSSAKSVSLSTTVANEKQKMKRNKSRKQRNQFTRTNISFNPSRYKKNSSLASNQSLSSKFRPIQRYGSNKIVSAEPNNENSEDRLFTSMKSRSRRDFVRRKAANRVEYFYKGKLRRRVPNIYESHRSSVSHLQDRTAEDKKPQPKSSATFKRSRSQGSERVSESVRKSISSLSSPSISSHKKASSSVFRSRNEQDGNIVNALMTGDNDVTAVRVTRSSFNAPRSKSLPSIASTERYISAASHLSKIRRSIALNVKTSKEVFFPSGEKTSHKTRQRKGASSKASQSVSSMASPISNSKIKSYISGYSSSDLNLNVPKPDSSSSKHVTTLGSSSIKRSADLSAEIIKSPMPSSPPRCEESRDRKLRHGCRKTLFTSPKSTPQFRTNRRSTSLAASQPTVRAKKPSASAPLVKKFKHKHVQVSLIPSMLNIQRLVTKMPRGFNIQSIVSDEFDRTSGKIFTFTETLSINDLLSSASLSSSRREMVELLSDVNSTSAEEADEQHELRLKNGKIVSVTDKNVTYSPARSKKHSRGIKDGKLSQRVLPPFDGDELDRVIGLNEDGHTLDDDEDSDNEVIFNLKKDSSLNMPGHLNNSSVFNEMGTAEVDKSTSKPDLCSSLELLGKKINQTETRENLAKFRRDLADDNDDEISSLPGRVSRNSDRIPAQNESVSKTKISILTNNSVKDRNSRTSKNDVDEENQTGPGPFSVDKNTSLSNLSETSSLGTASRTTSKARSTFRPVRKPKVKKRAARHKKHLNVIKAHRVRKQDAPFVFRLSGSGGGPETDSEGDDVSEIETKALDVGVEDLDVSDENDFFMLSSDVETGGNVSEPSSTNINETEDRASSAPDISPHRMPAAKDERRALSKAAEGVDQTGSPSEKTLPDKLRYFHSALNLHPVSTRDDVNDTRSRPRFNLRNRKEVPTEITSAGTDRHSSRGTDSPVRQKDDNIGKNRSGPVNTFDENIPVSMRHIMYLGQINPTSQEKNRNTRFKKANSMTDLDVVGSLAQLGSASKQSFSDKANSSVVEGLHRETNVHMKSDKRAPSSVNVTYSNVKVDQVSSPDNRRSTKNTSHTFNVFNAHRESPFTLKIDEMTPSKSARTTRSSIKVLSFTSNLPKSDSRGESVDISKKRPTRGALGTKTDNEDEIASKNVIKKADDQLIQKFTSLDTKQVVKNNKMKSTDSRQSTDRNSEIMTGKQKKSTFLKTLEKSGYAEKQMTSSADDKEDFVNIDTNTDSDTRPTKALRSKHISRLKKKRGSFNSQPMYLNLKGYKRGQYLLRVRRRGNYSNTLMSDTSLHGEQNIMSPLSKRDNSALENGKGNDRIKSLSTHQFCPIGLYAKSDDVMTEHSNVIGQPDRKSVSLSRKTITPNNQTNNKLADEDRNSETFSNDVSPMVVGSYSDKRGFSSHAASHVLSLDTQLKNHPSSDVKHYKRKSSGLIHSKSIGKAHRYGRLENLKSSHVELDTRSEHPTRVQESNNYFKNIIRFDTELSSENSHSTKESSSMTDGSMINPTHVTRFSGRGTPTHNMSSLRQDIDSLMSARKWIKQSPLVSTKSQLNNIPMFVITEPTPAKRRDNVGMNHVHPPRDRQFTSSPNSLSSRTSSYEEDREIQRQKDRPDSRFFSLDREDRDNWSEPETPSSEYGRRTLRVLDRKHVLASPLKKQVETRILSSAHFFGHESSDDDVSYNPEDFTDDNYEDVADDKPDVRKYRFKINPSDSCTIL